VSALQAQGYRPGDYYESNAELRAVLDLVRDGYFSRGDTTLFKPLIDGLLHWDPYMVLADYQSYADCQARAGRAYQDAPNWTAMSILNTARSGSFSSDRTIREYAQSIWRVPSVPIKLLSQRDLSFRVTRSS
jgi:starch phosphorylase